MVRQECGSEKNWWSRHFVVRNVDRLHFVVPGAPEVHTQGIENQWRILKVKAKSDAVNKRFKDTMKHLRGTTPELFEVYRFHFYYLYRYSGVSIRVHVSTGKNNRTRRTRDV